MDGFLGENIPVVKLRDIITRLKEVYCGNTGYEVILQLTFEIVLYQFRFLAQRAQPVCSLMLFEHLFLGMHFGGYTPGI